MSVAIVATQFPPFRLVLTGCAAGTLPLSPTLRAPPVKLLDVNKLGGGDDLMILIPKHIREQFERIGELDEPLAALEPLGAVREWLRESELHAIKQASEGGASLARIGNALGTDKQNIHQKLRMSQAGFDGGLDSRMLSWGEEILRCHVETEQISEGADRAGRPAGA